MDFKASAVSDSSYDDLYKRLGPPLTSTPSDAHMGLGERGGRKNMVNDLQIYSLVRQVLQSGNVSFLIGEQL